MDDSLALDRLRPAGGISALLAKTAAPEARPEGHDAEALPAASDDYQPYARAANRPLVSLHLILKDRSIENFQYGELTSRSRFVPADAESGGNLLILRFAGLEATEVQIAGRNLRALFDLITQHRIAWVAEMPQERDFADSTSPVVSRIGFRPVGTEIG